MIAALFRGYAGDRLHDIISFANTHFFIEFTLYEKASDVVES